MRLVRPRWRAVFLVSLQHLFYFNFIVDGLRDGFLPPRVEQEKTIPSSFNASEKFNVFERSVTFLNVQLLLVCQKGILYSSCCQFLRRSVCPSVCLFVNRFFCHSVFYQKSLSSFYETSQRCQRWCVDVWTECLCPQILIRWHSHRFAKPPNS